MDVDHAPVMALPLAAALFMDLIVAQINIYKY